MEKVGLIAEELADLTREIIEKHQMLYIPYIYDWPEEKEIPGGNLFKKMREAEKKGINTLINTSQPSPKGFLDAYKQSLRNFDKALCINFSSKMSGGHNSAIQAREFLKPEEKERIFPIDSLNASAGQALLVLKAVDLISQKKSAEEIVEEIKNFIPEVHLSGMIEDPKWLEYSGRISHSLANILRKFMRLGVAPLLGVKEGKITLVGIKRGVKDRSMALFKNLESEIRKFKKKNSKIRVVIVHGDNQEGADSLKKLIEDNLNDIEVVFVNLLDNVLGARLGPGVLLCAWCEI